MMKIKHWVGVTLVILTVACTSGPKNPGSGINFLDLSFEKAIKKARQAEKPIFIFGYTTWCGYCTKMSKTTLMEKEVCDYLNMNYISLSYDMEEGEGIDIGNRYGMKRYPSFVLLTKDGDLMKSAVGYMGMKEFLDFIQL